jgi:hypothetical protein
MEKNEGAVQDGQHEARQLEHLPPGTTMLFSIGALESGELMILYHREIPDPVVLAALEKMKHNITQNLRFEIKRRSNIAVAHDLPPHLRR